MLLGDGFTYTIAGLVYVKRCENLFKILENRISPYCLCRKLKTGKTADMLPLPVGLEQLAQRQALLAKQERGLG